MVLTKAAALSVLAVAALAAEDQPRPIRWIAGQLDVSPDTLHKLLQRLVRAGVLHSARGPSGGFRLARDPDRITLLQVAEAVEGPLQGRISPVHGVAGPPAAAQALTKAYQDLTDCASSLLGSVTITALSPGPGRHPR